eukprot:GHVU01071093.1.p1 GENE.GHVU01071093.1~~GHVU01071093.1.p1  ORF type:complete len:110 (-),score=9.40 GHVU01071093.1:252-557(-)
MSMTIITIIITISMTTTILSAASVAAAAYVLHEIGRLVSQTTASGAYNSEGGAVKREMEKYGNREDWQEDGRLRRIRRTRLPEYKEGPMSEYVQEHHIVLL